MINTTVTKLMSLSALHPITNDGRAEWSVFFSNLLVLVVLLSGVDGNHYLHSEWGKPGAVCDPTGGSALCSVSLAV